MASISHRYSIRWLPDPASEPTSTLVLTLASGFFIDIRIKHDKAGNYPPGLPVSEDDLLKPLGDGEDSPSPRFAVDWAFAGQSKSTPATSEDKPRQCTWEHWVDSRTNLIGGEPIKDSGAMYPPEGGKCLEKGSMVNPASGKETDYEEVWEDMLPNYTNGLEYEYYALAHDYKATDSCTASRGVVIQLGCWFQSIIRKDSDEIGGGDTCFGTARWKWNEEGEKWVLVAILGDCRPLAPDDVSAAFGTSGIRIGQTARISGGDWKCTELKHKI